jgi:phosphoribosyl-ATP pyrophosphohydrolase/phosphoribosyl-AMP cyclohydrolase
VLMLAWMDEVAFRKTVETGLATFWSRSRKEQWVKGATSGNTQTVKAVSLDCDGDAILLRVDPAGPACHNGTTSCFTDLPESFGETLAKLEKVLRQRRENPPKDSYTAKLFADEALRHKKLGEESAELIYASLRQDKERIASEAADLLFHTLVLLASHGLTLDDVAAILRSREGKRRTD